MATTTEFPHEGHTLLYRISRLTGNRLWAELRVLREETKLGETLFAQPQLLSYEGPGDEAEIDSIMRRQAEEKYGIQIPV